MIPGIEQMVNAASHSAGLGYVLRWPGFGTQEHDDGIRSDIERFPALSIRQRSPNAGERCSAAWARLR